MIVSHSAIYMSVLVWESVVTTLEKHSIIEQQQALMSFSRKLINMTISRSTLLKYMECSPLVGTFICNTFLDFSSLQIALHWLSDSTHYHPGICIMHRVAYYYIKRQIYTVC